MKTQTLNKILLLFCSIVLFAVALTFGADTEDFTTSFYQVDVSNVNAVHTFRSVMGLIIGAIAFWVYAAFDPKYSVAGLYALMFAMFGLVFGRLISFLCDAGEPISVFTYYLLAESVTGIAAFLLIRKNQIDGNKCEETL